KQSEKTTATFATALGINVMFNHFLFETGIGNSSFKTDFNSSTSGTTIDTSASHYNYLDSTYFIFDSSCVCTTAVTSHIDSSWASVRDTTISKTTVRSANKVSYIEIPLLLGYQ